MKFDPLRFYIGLKLERTIKILAQEFETPTILDRSKTAGLTKFAITQNDSFITQKRAMRDARKKYENTVNGLAAKGIKKLFRVKKKRLGHSCRTLLSSLNFCRVLLNSLSGFFIIFSANFNAFRKLRLSFFITFIISARVIGSITDSSSIMALI